MTELGESSSQRNYILVLVEECGSSCSGGGRRVGAFTSKEKAGKSNEPHTRHSSPHLLLSFFQKTLNSATVVA